jgi:hypothetical protein
LLIFDLLVLQNVEMPLENDCSFGSQQQYAMHSPLLCGPCCVLLIFFGVRWVYLELGNTLRLAGKGAESDRWKTCPKGGDCSKSWQPNRDLCP